MAKHRVAYAVSAAALIAGSGLFTPISSWAEAEITCAPVAAEDTAASRVSLNGSVCASFEAALQAIDGKGGENVIEVTGDIEAESVFMHSGTNVTLNLHGNTIRMKAPLKGSTGTESQNWHIERNSNVTFNDGKLIASDGAPMLIQNYANLTLHNMTVDGGDYALSINNGVVNITGGTTIRSAEGGVALDVMWWPDNTYTDGAQVTLNTTGGIENIEVGTSNKITDEQLNDVKTTLNIENAIVLGEISTYGKGGAKVLENVTISGGEFGKKPDQARLAPGKTAYVMSGWPTERYRVMNEIDASTDVFEEMPETVVAKVGEEINLSVSGHKIKQDLWYLATVSLENDDTESEASLGSVQGLSVFAERIGTGKIIVSFEGAYGGEARFDVPLSVYRVEDETDMPGLNDIISSLETTGAAEHFKMAENESVESLKSKIAATKEKGGSFFIDSSIEEISEEGLEAVADEIEAIEAAVDELETPVTIAQYYDIDMNLVAWNKTDGGVALGNVTEFDDEITVRMAAPSGLPEVAEGYTRKWYMFRYHIEDGEETGRVVALDATELNGVIIFKSDKFSTYGAGYEDVVATPDTGRNTMVEVGSKIAGAVLTSMAVAAVTMAGVAFHMNKRNK